MEEDIMQEQTPLWKKNADGLRQRASELRDYANTPVRIDTSGQRDYVQEFLDSRIAKSQETREDRAAREKRERTTRQLAALTDGLVALSNVAGAMGGATPVKQTSMSAAHKKAVDDAKERRRLLAKEYETARQNAMTLAMKQSKDNADRIAAEQKRRTDAAKQADALDGKAATLDGKAATLEQQGAAADRSYDLGKRRQEAAERHQGVVMERQGAERNGISRQRETRLRNGGGGDSADFDEYARWKEAHPEEVEQIRSDNAQIDMMGRPTKAVTNTIVKLTNAAMRRKYGTPQESTAKKTIKGFGGTSRPNNGKKNIKGFGGN